MFYLDKPQKLIKKLKYIEKRVVEYILGNGNKGKVIKGWNVY